MRRQQRRLFLATHAPFLSFALTSLSLFRILAYFVWDVCITLGTDHVLKRLSLPYS